MSSNILLQLRDCLIEILGTPPIKLRVCQAKYILRNFTRLLRNGGAKPDLQGSFICEVTLMEGLIDVCENAFCAAVKISESTHAPLESFNESLEEIFEILCVGNALDDPVVVCAAYISLLKTSISPNTSF